MEGKLLAIGLSLLILAQACLLRRYIGTWIFPACIFGLFWFAFTFFPMILLFNVPVQPLAVAYILAACLVFSGTAMIFRWKDALYANSGVHLAAASDGYFLRYVFYGLSLFVAVSTIANWGLQGVSLHELFFDFFKTGNEFLKRKYAGEIQGNFVSKLSVAFVYPVAILGGVIYSGRSSWREELGVVGASFLAPVLQMAVEGNKGVFFLSAAFFWGGCLIAQIGRGEFRVLTRKGLIGLAVGIVICIPLLISAFWIRMIERVNDSDQLLSQMIWYFYSYTCGHLYAFSDWFSASIGAQSMQSYSNDSSANGFYTFMGLFRMLGDSRVIPPGNYSEYFVYQQLMQSNIYTVFRGLITDFGMRGGLLFCGVSSFVVHFFFRCLLLGRIQALSMSIFVHFVGFVYSSFLISLLMWKSIYLSIATTIIIFQINHWLHRKIPGVCS